jgi:hypothetical protein
VIGQFLARFGAAAGDDDGRTSLGERDRSCPPDPTQGTGDEDDGSGHDLPSGSQ